VNLADAIASSGRTDESARPGRTALTSTSRAAPGSGPADEPAAKLRLAFDRHQAGARSEAESLYRQVLDAHPHELAALYLYGIFNVEAGRTGAAEPLLERFVALQPANPHGYLALADLALRTGRRSQAIHRYREALRAAPNHPVAVSQLASIVLEDGFAGDAGFDGAIEVCRAAIALLPDPALAQAVLAKFLAAAGRTGEAVEAYRAALALKPSDLDSWTGLALALLGDEDSEEALKATDAALALDRDSAAALYVRGSALLKLHRPQAAREAFERGVIAAPDQARMRLGLGDACAELDRDGEALEHLRRAVALDPASKWAQANLGSTLYRCGDLESAERHCRLALAIDPELFIAHQNLAGILAEHGALEEARRHRDAAYRLRNLLVERAPQAAARVLTLTTVGSGNVPHRRLLPKDRYTRIDWFIEYAQDGQASRLPPYDVVFNIIGDPDYSAATDRTVLAFLDICERPVINDPARIGPTRRDRLPVLLGDIRGVSAPRAARLDPGSATVGDLVAWLAAEGLSFPVLIRPIGSHGGQGLALAKTAEDLAGIDAAEGLYATEFVDFRSPADGLYRKYRAIFVDRTPYPYHLAIKNDWLVHYYSAEMSGDAARKAEELRFLEDPRAAVGEDAWAAIGAIGRRLDLDYAGIDFSRLPDGRVLVFEANATMLVHPEPDEEFTYKNPHVARITDAFQALLGRRIRAGQGGR
jgi:tetratricopeptide (TPR) repeat protein